MPLVLRKISQYFLIFIINIISEYFNLYITVNVELRHRQTSGLNALRVALSIEKQNGSRVFPEIFLIHPK